MSLPLRNALENVSSLDRVLEDLLVRFIINCPSEDLSSVERELFHFEEASWFYTDFIKLMNQNLPTLKIKSLSQLIIKICPLIWKWDIKADEALAKFSRYKKTIPVRGAAIFNEDLNKILLVKGTESDSWSFPRGKISKDEDDEQCCIREVKEEIGFDLTDYIDENQFIERNISAKNYKIYLIKDVPEDFFFQPQVRNEIEKIKWFDFKTVTKNIYKSNNNGSFKYYLINSMIRPISMWVKHQKQVKNEDQLKQYAEEQLKLLLGITKEETIDPGRDLLNMLHSAVQSTHIENQQSSISTPAFLPTQNLPFLNSQNNSNGNGNSNNIFNNPILNNSNIGHLPIIQQTPMFVNMMPPVRTTEQSTIRSMGFQPFTPFGFTNGSLPNGLQTPFVLPNSVQGPMFPVSQVPLSPRNLPHPLNESQPIHIPSTPNVQSLSKPSLVTSDDNQTSNHLMSMLQNTQKSVSHLSLQSSPSSPSTKDVKPKMRILQRGEELPSSEKDVSETLSKNIHGQNIGSKLPSSEILQAQHNNVSNDVESQNLLSLLKKPTAINTTSPIATTATVGMVKSHQLHNQPISSSYEGIPSESVKVHAINSDNNDDEFFENHSFEEDEPDSLPPSVSVPPIRGQKPLKISDNDNVHSETEVTEENYSDFEDSTDSEDDVNAFRTAYESAPIELQSEEESEELEILNENESPSKESLPDSILQENNFAGGEIPHKNEKSESMVSVKGFNINTSNSNINSLNNNIKPKFKILKRGEKLEDIAKNSLSSPSINDHVTNKQQPSVSTHEAIKTHFEQQQQQQQQYTKLQEEQSPDLLAILKNRFDLPNTTPQSVRKSSIQKSEETNNELLNLLKKNSQGVQEFSEDKAIDLNSNNQVNNNNTMIQSTFIQGKQPDDFVFFNNQRYAPSEVNTNQQATVSSGGDLLRMLQSKSNKSNQGTPEISNNTSLNSQSSHPVSQISPQSAHSLLNESAALLSMLKNPSRSTPQPQQQCSMPALKNSSQNFDIFHQEQL
ncbi:hypothetical protein RI543_000889 [Arxiozyma heterogenica]|uniref:Nudix hydrolase domain-containing protein n=1 Tax=Arxiozyma heterogenica TaxID=278026 RepID=A0AAN7WJ03_9SACH|nr:hypothetical protein RI543_000889 [Kazachstania heterogenica]